MRCQAEQFQIQTLCNAPPARLGRYGNTVNVNESGKTGLKPQIIWAIIIGILVERDQQAIGLANPPRKERRLYQMT